MPHQLTLGAPVLALVFSLACNGVIGDRGAPGGGRAGGAGGAGAAGGAGPGGTDGPSAGEAPLRRLTEFEYAVWGHGEVLSSGLPS